MMLTAKRGRKNEYLVRPLAGSQIEADIQQCLDAAANGTEAFRTFWKERRFTKEQSAELKPHMQRFEDEAKKADEQAKPLSQRLNDTSTEADSDQDERQPGEDADEDVVDAPDDDTLEEK